MDTLTQTLGVDPLKAALIALGTAEVTDLLKTIFKVRGWGVPVLAFFVALFISVLWIVPWTTHQEADALLASLKTATITAVAAVSWKRIRAFAKDYFGGKSPGDNSDTATSAPTDTLPPTDTGDTTNEQS